ncbi:MAG TPA: hypothetical protein VFS50_12650 [Meiothermus sp.]|nr:hypothetical protein [Meiothermus sp.]
MVIAKRLSAYVFVSCHQPKRVVQALKRLPGVTRADLLLGSEAVLLIEEKNFEALQLRLVEVQATPGVRKVSVRLAA